VVLLLLVVLGLAYASRRDFLQFQRKYNKVYSTKAEFEKRFQIFQDNMAWAKELTAQNNGSARFGATKFSDLSKEEFARWYLMPNYNVSHQRPPVKTHFPKPPKGKGPDPTNYDWGTAGVVTPVKDQGQCGSCWAFSATETIESYWALAGNQLVGLSEEQIVDCDTTDGGCNGGETQTAYAYVYSAGGMDTESAYPYSGGGSSCNFDASGVVAKISSENGIAINGEDGIYQQASTAGPVSVCVAASTWQNYQGGILTSCDTQVDHCVQLTGYNSYGQSGAYWNVRNSWGSDWGESGYIWVAIGQDLCQIGDDATIVSI